MDRNPFFSVIIANYNNGCYLQDAIDSLLAQKYDNWEAIIIDDASPDNSKEIYDKFKDDPRFRIVFNEENKGYAYSVNRGVRLAKGTVCARLDPDDVLFGTDVLETHVQKHLEMPEVTLVYSGMYRADENLNIVSEVYRWAVPEGSSILEMRGWPVQHFASFKREAFLRVGGCDETQRRAVDYGLYYRLEEVGKTYYLNRLQYVQRNNSHSMSLNDNQYKAHAWHVYACVEAMKRRGLTDESLMLFPMEASLKKEYQKGYEKATSSRVYKAGLVLASPIIWLKKLLKR